MGTPESAAALVDALYALRDLAEAVEGLAVYPEGSVGLEALAEAETKARSVLDRFDLDDEALLGQTRRVETPRWIPHMSDMSVEEMEAFIAEHGLPAFLDHLGLDAAANEVVALLALRDQLARLLPKPQPTEPRTRWYS